MPIDVETALAAELKEVEYEFTDKEVLLYALGVGAGIPSTDKDQLKFTFENGMKTLPTFGVVPAFPALLRIISCPGLKFNPMMLLHGEQFLEIRKYPIPTRGKLTTKPKVSAIYDKGKGALVILDAITTNDKGEELFFNSFSCFLRGEGGFGGEKGPQPGNEPPDREPDKVLEMPTLPHQNLIYRLSGDRNPLHSDPNFAKMAGFEKPIMHGLCTYGMVGRAVLQEFCGNDPAKFKSLGARFSSHVFPGETVVVEMWKESDTKIVVKAKTAERGLDVITNAAVTLNA